MKNVKLILASFCLVFVGCDDDDDVVAADSCTTYLMSYMEYTDAIAAGTATAADCVDGTTTLQDWCVAGCEADDTPEEQAVCDETFEALTTEEITASCDALFPSDDGSGDGFSLSGTFNATSVTMYMTEDCSGDGMTGMCMDGVSADEATCSEAGATWMAYSDMLGESSVTFNEDGTFTDSDYPEEINTYTCSSATSCSSDGVTFTVNSDGTVTSTAGDAAYCADADDEVDYDTYTTQEDCEANGSAADAADGVWYDASCASVVWTAATGS